MASSLKMPEIGLSDCICCAPNQPYLSHLSAHTTLSSRSKATKSPLTPMKVALIKRQISSLQTRILRVYKTPSFSLMRSKALHSNQKPQKTPLRFFKLHHKNTMNRPCGLFYICRVFNQPHLSHLRGQKHLLKSQKPQKTMLHLQMTP